MRILITGGGGFLGGEICKQLLAEGHEVLSLQRTHSKDLDILGVKQVLADLSKKDILFQNLSSIGVVDAVFHTAAKAGVWGSYESYYSANVMATENILAWSKANKIKYFVYTSTPSVIFSNKAVEWRFVTNKRKTVLLRIRINKCFNCFTFA